MESKIISMPEAISRYVQEGSTIFISGAQHGEPSAMIHEIIRQGRKDLAVVSALTHTLPLLIGAGLVSKIYSAFIHQNAKTDYAFIRAEKTGRVPVIQEYSHHSISLALMAGSMNVPYLPTRVLLGSDIMKHNADVKELICPFTGDKLAAVRGIQPDLGMLHVQRCDDQGNGQKWGSLGLDLEGIGASRKVILSAEEIVATDVIRREPNLTIIPGFRVAAVVHQPFGAYPMHMAGCYNGDVADFEKEIKTPEGFENYLREYVYGVSDWNEYLRKMDAHKGVLHNLKIKEPLWSVPICTGY